MSKLWSGYRYFIGRRLLQLSIPVLYFGANAYGWTILEGNLSMAKFLEVVPLADPFAVLQILCTGFILATDALIGALVIAAFYGLFAGRAFCSWVCPMNLVTDLAFFLRRKTKQGDVVGRIGIRRGIRYWILALTLVMSAFLGVGVFEYVSPITMISRGLIFSMGFGYAAVSVVFLFDIFVLRNGFCGHLCPLGGFYSLLGRYSLLRVNHIAENCTNCMNCLVICPERQVLPMIGKYDGPVLSGECVNCMRCIEVCNDNALRLGTRFNPSKESSWEPVEV